MAVGLYTPIEQIPVLTSGRVHDEVAGHEAGYVLDNNTDTYWESDTFSGTFLFLDAGETVTLDAVAFWLQNFTDPYNDDKYFQIAYSDDDVTYNNISVGQSFETYRSADQRPLVVQTFSPVAARYWTIAFFGFDGLAKTEHAKVSCVWLLKSYSLPFSHQKPERYSIKHFNYQASVRSGHGLVSPMSFVKQRILERSFIFTRQTDLDTLLAAYNAVRGTNKPIFIQADYGSTLYTAATFESDLEDELQEYSFWTPTVTLRELGFSATLADDSRVLYPVATTLGLYRFQNNRNDSSSNGNNLLTFGTAPTYNAFGAAESGTTVVSVPNGSFIYIIDDTFFPGTGDFTVEAWFRGATTCLIARCTNNATPAPITAAGYWFGTVTGKAAFSVRDAAGHTVTISGADTTTAVGATTATANHVNNRWHYMAGVINQTDDTIKVYIDGVLEASKSISTVTGAIEQAAGTATLIGGETANNAQLWIDELHFCKQALTATAIMNRYLGRSNPNLWDK